MCARLAGVLSAAAIAAGCSGPPAPDAAICQDIIHRLCLPVRCSVATFTLGVGDDCEDDLLTRTGCSEDDFTFQEPLAREPVLQCRVALVRAGLSPEQLPNCADVSDMLELCPDLTAFLRGAP